MERIEREIYDREFRSLLKPVVITGGRRQSASPWAIR
jgi:hypothetical protein